MALVVEDGTGLSDAESYISVAQYKAYADGRGYDHSALSDTQIEQKLREGAQFVDTIGRFKGVQLVSTQALEWPRSGCIDWSGNTVSGVPKRVKDAQAEATYKAQSGALYTDADRGGMIKSESVGPISVTYMDGAPATKLFTAVMNLLKPYFRAKLDPGAPYNGQTDRDPYLTNTLHDDPATSDSLESAEAED
jgi:hypothetical protein